MNLMKEIHHLYYEEKLSTKEVGEKLRVSKSFVSAQLKEMNGANSMKESLALRSTTEFSEKIRLTPIGEKNNSIKLNESDVIAIRSYYQSAIQTGSQKTATQYYLAEQYGVKRTTISDIVLNYTWKHIKPLA